MRIRIVELMIVVGVICFATACLVEATPLAAFVFSNFAYIVMLIALPMAIGRQRGSRAFWIGFLGASVAYTAFSMTPDYDGYSPRVIGGELTTALSRLAFEEMHPELAQEFSVNGSFSGTFFNVTEPGAVPLFNQEMGGTSVDSEPSAEDPFADIAEAIADTTVEWEEINGDGTIEPLLTRIICGVEESIYDSDLIHFMTIAHSLWALLLGWGAGHLSRFIYVRSRITKN